MELVCTNREMIEYSGNCLLGISHAHYTIMWFTVLSGFDRISM